MKKGKNPIQKLVRWIYKNLWVPKGARLDRRLMGQIRLLNPVSDEEVFRMVRRHRLEQIHLVVLYVFAVLAFLIILAVAAFLPPEPVKIERNNYGEGDKEEMVYAGDSGEINFTVGAREYKKEELEEAFKEGFSWARKQMLARNPSAADIRKNLNFVTGIPGGLSAEWISSDPDLIREDGTVCNEGWEEGRRELACVSLLLSYGSEIRRQEIYFTVKAPKLTEAAKQKEKVLNTIRKREEQTRTSLSFELPAFVSGIKISKERPYQQAFVFFLLLSVLFFLFIYQKQSSLKEQMEKRKREILEDYPLIINQMVLYLGAGMNLKAAFAKMAAEYGAAVSQGRKKPRYAYEELGVMMNEMKAGVPEGRAYESYGGRMGEGCYLKLMALVVQNLQKGSAGLLKALSEEEAYAFGLRLGQAKKLGEEAGTKLLFPMVLLLAAVMAVVMLPAVFQFQGY